MSHEPTNHSPVHATQPVLPAHTLQPTEAIRDIDSVLITETDVQDLEESAPRAQRVEVLAGGEGSHHAMPVQSVVDNAMQSPPDPGTLGLDRRVTATESREPSLVCSYSQEIWCW